MASVAAWLHCTVRPIRYEFIGVIGTLLIAVSSCRPISMKWLIA